METTVRPDEARRRRVDTTLRALNESSPDVGSSRKRTEESATSSVAIETRLRSPPDIPRMVSSPI